MSTVAATTIVRLVSLLLLAIQVANAMPSQPLIGDLDGLSMFTDHYQQQANNNLRLRRQVSNLLDHQLIQQVDNEAARPNLSGQPRQQLPLLLSANQQFLDDEQTIRTQLPELIAQAHQDKTVERALLKMLINASLRSALSNMVGPSGSSSSFATALDSSSALTPQQQQQLLVNLDGANNWLDLDGSISGDQVASGGMGASGRLISARLTGEQQQQQQRGEFADQQQQQVNAIPTGRQLAYGTQGLVDKREYIKPCSFNAISCVRTPFRKP